MYSPGGQKVKGQGHTVTKTVTLVWLLMPCAAAAGVGCARLLTATVSSCERVFVACGCMLLLTVCCCRITTIDYADFSRATFGLVSGRLWAGISIPTRRPGCALPLRTRQSRRCCSRASCRRRGWSESSAAVTRHRTGPATVFARHR